MLPALLLVLLVNFAPSELVLPAGERAAKHGKQRAIMGIDEQSLIESSTITPEDGVWLRRTLEDGQEYHVGGVDNQGKLTGLLLYRIDASNRLVEAVFGQRLVSACARTVAAIGCRSDNLEHSSSASRQLDLGLAQSDQPRTACQPSIFRSAKDDLGKFTNTYLWAADQRPPPCPTS